MAEIYVPIDFSDIKNVIPPGEDIIYSTLCQGTHSQNLGTKTKTWKWISHCLMTKNGVAYTFPSLQKKKEPPQKIYSKWEDILAIASAGKFGVGFTLSLITSYKLVRNENFETKEKFKERSKAFVAKFRPLVIKKQEEWLEANRNNPEVRKRDIKITEKSIRKMKGWEQKRLAKEAKKK